MQHRPLSARGELQSHPLAGQAQACGHPTQVDGPGGPMAPVVATGWYHCSKKNLTTFLDSCTSSLRLSMLFFSVSFKRETPRTFFPELVLTWRSSYADTVGEKSRNWQELMPMYRRDSSPEYSTRIPYVSSMPPYITARHILYFTPWKLHTQRKKTCHLRGHAARKKRKTRYVLSLYLPKHSNLTNINARLREHPQPTSRMPKCVACHPCRWHPCTPTLQGVPPVATAARRSAPESGAQAPSIARLLPTLPRHQRRCPALACMVRRTHCPLRPTPPAQVQRWPPSFPLKRPRRCA